MSNHLTSLAYKVELGSLLRKAVMVKLADLASDDGHGIWASKQTIADELCCTKRAVITTIQHFEEEGLLAKVGERPCRTGYTTEYILRVAKLAALPKVKRWSKGCTTFTGEPHSPVNEVHGRGKSHSPKPSLNRNKIKKDRAREIADDWKPELDPKSETAKFMATWPPGFAESEVERFIGHHQSRGTTSKNWNRQWATWALGDYCRKALREWNDERNRNGGSGNAFTRAAARAVGESRGAGGNAAALQRLASNHP